MYESAFRDREEAGRELAAVLHARHPHLQNPLVLALPRGGVPVALEVARRECAPMDIVVVRKLGVPGQEELAMGAIASGGVGYVNDDVVKLCRISEAVFAEVASREEEELKKRELSYRGFRPPEPIRGRCVLIVDDGLATGASMRAAIRSIRKQGPARVMAAVPVGSQEACDALLDCAEDVICAKTPRPFFAVGHWYEEFDQVSDDNVRRCLERARNLGNGFRAA